MRKLLTCCYFFFLLGTLSFHLLAQSASITGRVVDVKGLPISGATITLKGTTTATSTTINGNFSLTVSQPNSVLTISYIGYTNREVNSIATSPITIVLQKSATDLDDVVVQAYGTTTRRLNTGSIGRVSALEIEKQPVTNPLSALQGRIPGVLITQSSGVPGSEIRIEIRGRSSLDFSLSRNDPLYVIDGVPFEPGNVNSNQLRSAATNPTNSSQGGLSPLNAINPSDIESIEVLKDADATAIYGSRGANGVVLITTKKGKPGKTRLTLNSSLGASHVARSMDMLNTTQYIAMRREAFANDGTSPTAANSPDLLVWDTTRYTDLKQAFIGRSALSSFNQLSLSGGSATTQFSVAGGYNRLTNVFSSDLSDQVRSARVTLNHTSPDQRFALLFTGIYANDRNALISTDLTRYINLPPNMKLLDSVGNLNWSEKGSPFASLNLINPLALLRQPYISTSDNLSGNLNISYRILNGLVLRASTGYNTFSTTETVQRPRSSLAPTSTTLASSEFAGSSSKSYILEPQLEYTHTLGSGRLSLLAGSTFQNRTFSSYSMTGTNYTNDLLLGAINAAGTITASNAASEYRYAALFGRINWAWDHNTYILNLSGRKDASSRFGADKRTATFGAVGAAWLFTNYAFVKEHFPVLSFGKLRASYGITGNDQIGNYRYLDLWNPTTVTYQGVPGFTPNSLYNADYSWEINKKLEGAIELGFLKDRIQLSAAYFRNRCSNQVTNYLLPSQTGFETVVRNLPALVENTGLELSLSGKIVRTEGLEWSAALNMTLPRNRLISFPGLAASSYASLYEEGKSLSLIRAYEYGGVDPKTGIYQFTDVNKDGAINSRDVLSFGNLDPQWYGGFQTALDWKGFQLSAFFEFRKQTGRNYLSQLSSTAPGTAYNNQPVIVLNRWQQEGNIAPVQRFTASSTSAAGIAVRTRLSGSNGIYADASYIRCKNISLSYALPTEWTHKVHIESCRFFINAQNLFVLTHYEGADPETQNFYILPPLRSLVGGIQITL